MPMPGPFVVALAVVTGALAAGEHARADEVYLRIAPPDAEMPAYSNARAPLEITSDLAPGKTKRSEFTWKGARYRVEVAARRRPREDQVEEGTVDWSARVSRGGKLVSAYTIQTYARFPTNCGTSPNAVFDGLWIVIGVAPRGEAARQCEAIVKAARRGHV